MIRYILIVAAAIVLLFSWSWWVRENGEKVVRFWGETEVRCLPNGHENLARHIHPTLRVFVDGVLESVPANIGIFGDCMAEVHTHDSSGQIHIETTDASREFVLGDFFAVGGMSLHREGYTLTASLNGKEITNSEGVVLRDHDIIELSYTVLTE
jgi:hypothetical protein